MKHTLVTDGMKLPILSVVGFGIMEKEYFVTNVNYQTLLNNYG